MINKQNVNRHFSKAAAEYDRYACVQKKMAQRLIQKIQLERPPQHILEIGCGTGCLTRELAERLGAKAYLIDNAVQMNKSWFNGVSSVGVTAGASAPEVLIQEVLDTLQAWGGDVPSELSGIEENVTFSLPKSLR